jgi:RecA/RadA recombinase
MALKGKSPSSTEKKLKALFYGEAGAGKTTADISFPKCYLIDTEHGSDNDQYVKLLADNGSVVFHTADFDELVNEVKSLLTEKHEYRTLIIDPLTTLYNDLLDKSEREVGSDFGRHYQHSSKKMKQLLNLLLRLPMNVIVTCHAKNEYGDNMKIIGTTFDGYKKLDYLFDLVFCIQKRGKQRVAMVKKTRIEAFNDGEIFPFSYDEVANRYGREVLEMQAEPEQLATKEQMDELKRLIELLKIPAETIQKWLDKAAAIDLAEMNSDSAQKVIDYLNKQIKGVQ